MKHKNIFHGIFWRRFSNHLIVILLNDKFLFTYYRKYDIEAWLPGRKTYGEISSCSNCTDYQSRRLQIKYENNGEKKFVHTLNGTACAIPRTLIALLETHQNPKGKIDIPKVLQPFISGKQYITKNTNVPDLKLFKSKKII